jgi:hypothetical protein
MLNRRDWLLVPALGIHSAKGNNTMQPIKDLTRGARAAMLYFLTRSIANEDGTHTFKTSDVMPEIGLDRPNTCLALRTLERAGWIEFLSDQRSNWRKGHAATIRLLCERQIPLLKPKDSFFLAREKCVVVDG